MAGFGRGMPLGRGMPIIGKQERSPPAEATRSAGREDQENKELAKWNPIQEAFDDQNFNSYDRGPGRNLPKGKQAPDPARMPDEDLVKLYVTGIPNALTQEGLLNIFSSAGEVKHCRKCQSRVPGARDTFGFIGYQTLREANEAIRLFDGRQIENNSYTLRVKIAMSDSEKKARKEGKSDNLVSMYYADGNTSDYDSLNGSHNHRAAQQAGIGQRRTEPAAPAILDRPSSRSSEDGYQSQGSDAGGTKRRNDRKMPKTEPKQPKPCLNCKTMGKYNCKICKGPYCSADCQKQDWHRHKLICGKKDTDVVSKIESDFEVDVGDEMASFLAEQMGHKGPLNEPSPPMSAYGGAGRVKCDDVAVEELPNVLTKVVVTHHWNPNQFHIGLAENGPLLTRVNRQLQEMLADTQNIGKGSYCPEVGELCAALWCREWFRGRVDRILNDGKMDIYFVDYGNQSEIPVTRIRKLPVGLEKYKRQAIMCSLEGVPQKKWKQGSPDFILAKQKIVEDRPYLAKKTRFENCMTYVELIDLSEEKGFNVAEVIMEGSYRGAGDRQQDLAASRDGHLNPRRGYEGGDRGNQDAQRMSPVANRQQRTTPSKTSPNETQRARTSPTASTAMTPLGLMDDSQIMLPSVAKFFSQGESVKLLVIEVDSPSQFWAQVPEDKTLQELPELQVNLNLHYGAKPLNKSGYRLTAKNLVAAKFDEDLAWYRGHVIAGDTSGALVRFIDFGNTARCAFTELHSLESDFCSLPLQAVRCSLSNIQSVSGEWTDEATSFFKSLVMGFHVVGTVVTHDNNSAQLTIEVEGQDKPIAQLMIEAGHAKPGSCQSLPPQLIHHNPPKPTRVTSPQPTQPPGTSQPSLSRVGQSISPGTSQPSLSRVGQSISPGASQPSLSRVGQSRSPGASQPSLSRVGHSISPGASQPSLSRVGQSISPGASQPSLSREATPPQPKVKQASSPVPNAIPPLVRLSSLPDPILPDVDTPALCVVIDASGPDKFHVNAAVGNTAEKIQELCEALQQHYGNDGGAYMPSLEEIVAAKFIDNSWYRALVLKIDGSQIHVHFVDYGNDDVIDVSRIRTLDPKFVEYNVQAICCGLAGVELVRGATWNPARLTNNSFQILLRKKTDSKWIVDLIDEGKSVADDLMKEGIVCPARVVVMADSLPRTEFPAGQPLSCILTDVQDLHNFSLQIYEIESAQKIQSLVEKLNAHYASDEDVYEPQKEGELVVARFSQDKSWYRAKVVSIGQQGSKLHVQYVDYGNSEENEVTNVRAIADTFIENFPVQALACSLSEVTLAPGQSLTAEHLETFNLYSVVKVGQAGDIHEVKLFRRTTEESVANELVKQGVCVTVGAEPATPERQTAEEGALPMQQFDCKDPECMVWYIQDLSSFYVQWLTLETQSLLQELDKNLQTICAKEKALTSCQAKGHIIGALNPTDNRWYRAQVLEEDRDKALIQFIDYGDSATVEISNMRILPADFLFMPRQAIHCQLQGHYTEKQKEQLGAAIINQKVTLGIEGLENDQYIVNDIMIKGVSTKEMLAVESKATEKVETVQPQELATPRVELDVGDVRVVTVSHVKSPSCFYVTVSDETSRQHNHGLLVEMDHTYSKMKAQSYMPQVGEVVAGFFQDAWYRATVCDVKSGLALLYFVDYGNTDGVLLSNIRPLQPQFTLHAHQAVKCALTDGTASPVWNPNATELFKSNALNQTFTMTVHSTSEEGLGVTLTTEDNASLMRLLVVEGTRIPSVPVTSTPQLSADTSYFCRDLPARELPSNFLMVISEHIDPTHFYFQVLNDDDIAAGRKLMDMLNEYCSGVEADPLLQPKLGELLCVRFSEDRVFYRGHVTQVTDNGFLAQFIDYGNCEFVSDMTEARVMHKDFMTLPAQAVRARLNGIAPVGTCWSGDAIAHFKETSGNVPLEVSLIGHADGEYSLNVVDARDNTNCAEDLVRAGHACYTKQEPIQAAAPGAPAAAPGAAAAAAPAPAPAAAVGALDPEALQRENEELRKQLQEMRTMMEQYLKLKP